MLGFSPKATGEKRCFVLEQQPSNLVCFIALIEADENNSDVKFFFSIFVKIWVFKVSVVLR